MKTTAVALLFAQLALSTAVPKQLDNKVSYDGYKAFRIKTDHNSAAIESELSRLSVVPLNLDTDKHIDVAVAPQDVAAFEALKFTTDVMHEDLGADIAKEAVFAPYEGQSRSLSEFLAVDRERLTRNPSHGPGHSEHDLVQLVPCLCRPCQVLQRPVGGFSPELGNL